MPYSILKSLNWFWENNENWPWLRDKPLPLQALNRQLWKASVPSVNYYLLLVLSAVIATFGLLANSAATIIGAMIIAPLIGPIMGIAYAMVLNNRKLLKRASLTLLTGVVMTILASVAIAYVVGLKSLRPEILARANPSLMDLGVAMAAGAAGAYAKSRRSIADALPGVAIAVALVPPLSVIGIGIALQNQQVAIGAFLLFMTNLTGIIFSGGIILLCQRYGTMARAKGGLVLSIIILSLLGIPLGFSLNNLLVRENVRREVELLISDRKILFPDVETRVISVQPQGKELIVELEVVTTDLMSISEQQVRAVKQFLEQKLEVPVNLKVQILPARVFEIPSVEEE